LGRLNVITGPSGCGKSSLAFETIYAEGQRRYVETFSPYTRQFLERMDKPKVDSIRGIPPAIAIEQANSVKTTRSTVGTMTEINDYLKCLMPHAAEARCPACARRIRPETASSIVDEIIAHHREEALLVTFAVPVPTETRAEDFFSFLQQQGYLRVWIDGAIARTDAGVAARGEKGLPSTLRVVQDRIIVRPEDRARLCEAVEIALRFGKGRITFLRRAETNGSDDGTGTAMEIPFSNGWHCAHCDIDITPPSPGLFSFNHPLGACPRCRGFGRTIGIDLERAIPDRRMSLRDGAIKPFRGENGRECQRDLLRCAATREVDVKCPFDELPRADQQWVLLGESPGAPASEMWEAGLWYGVKGFFEWLESKAYKMHVRVLLSRYRTYTECPDCRGGRYQPAALNFRFCGKTLPELMALPLNELWGVIAGFAPAKDDTPARTLCTEIATRLRYLNEVGLDYLSLDRPTRSLSGGEMERVNLTTCLGASLVNTLFVLDEPSVGLHPRDTGRLIRVMKELRDKGNTLLVVEHEEAVIRAADHLVELGPGRGAAGGHLVFAGPAAKLLEAHSGTTSGSRLARGNSLTAEYLTGRKTIPVPGLRRAPRRFLKVRGARAHNLRDLDVDIPLGVFVCVTGVSGSGKSTLVHEVLYRNVLEAKGLPAEEGAVGGCASIEGVEQIDQIVMVDQSPLSRTPRSSPALYLGVFDAIRELFAMSADARAQGISAGSFSFNAGTGRCERCSGNGFEKIEMQFLSDVFVRCPECEGRRFQPHILAIRLHEKSIHEVLELTVSEAIEFFSAMGASRIAEPLKVLEEVGLGYLTLGQPLNVLSGGESQRLKLVERLTKQSAGNALLIFDEPTTGLHLDDVAQLLQVFQRLVEQGNSVLVIEHNLEVIKCADQVVDLGPEAGRRGGLLVAQGTPEEIAAVPASHTGRYLARCMPGLFAHDVETPDASELRVAEEPGADASHDLGAGARPGHGRAADRQIEIFGAREHNLKNISLAIPRDELVVVTGLSGSGKSTLAFDICFAEGQRRFLDSMSAYARQFVQQLEKPDVDLICGLPPSVAIEQRVTRGGGKSTVATVTEVYHFLRLLFAKLGMQFCPRCDLPVEKQSLASIVARAERIARKGRIKVLAPLVKARKGFHTDVAKWALRNGFDELLVDGELVTASRFPKLERFREHSIAVVVGQRASPQRIRELLKRALDLGKGTALLLDARGGTHIVSSEMSCPGCGDSFEELDPRLFSFNSPHGWCPECRGFGEVWSRTADPRLDGALEIELEEERQHESLDAGESQPCPVCNGARLNRVARHVHLRGCKLESVVALSARSALAWALKLKFRGREETIAADIVPEIVQRLRFMAHVGLDYLALNRSAMTLSGGESQRIRLAAQLGSNLRGVLYVLDEPTIGLHPRDNAQLLETLIALRDRGNSLLIVEHDEETMRRADTIIDLGPGAGRRGGAVVAQGPIEEICANDASATGRFLREPLSHPTRGKRRPITATELRWLELRGASAHNLKKVAARFPLGRLTVITGISGSGKSSLMRHVLKPCVTAALAKGKRGRKRPGVAHDPHDRSDESCAQLFVRARGDELPLTMRGEKKGDSSLAADVEAVYEVDQSPIGKTSRSTPATYIKVFDEIRKLFAQVPLARMRGYSASRFSFNTEGGRCETCAGQGMIKVEMAFLPTSFIPCDACEGRRYNPATLDVLYNDKSIGDVMAMTMEQAADFFGAHPRIERPLRLLCDTGLGYLALGQASPTLSGGEAQRLKLVSELNRGAGRVRHARLREGREPKTTLYLLEEPTIGLHMADVQELLKVLHRLVDDGQTVIVIEHNLSVIADADYVIDIGPEAGERGGEVVVAGTPEQVAKTRRSRTAPFLREELARSGEGPKGPRGRKRRQPTGDLILSA
jgi:excinuclease ABC subunit A